MGADIVMPAVQIKVVMQMKSAELNARTSLVCCSRLYIIL